MLTRRLRRDHVAGHAALRLEQQTLGLDVDDLTDTADLERRSSGAPVCPTRIVTVVRSVRKPDRPAWTM